MVENHSVDKSQLDKSLGSQSTSQISVMEESQSLVQSKSSAVIGSQPTSYATVTSEVYPTEEQAIVIDAVEGLTISDYVYAVAEIIGSQNIHYVSRISLSRVCMYLSNVELANKITDDNNNKIKIKQHDLEIRPLKAKTQRVVFSNVNPVIPNHVIIEKIKSYGITVNNSLTPVRAGISGEGFSHIRSFRRQLHLLPREVEKLPKEIPVIINAVRYHIYPSTEKISCFICKTEGHIAKHCKNSVQVTQFTNKQGMDINSTDESFVNLQSNLTSDTETPNNLMPPPDDFQLVDRKRQRKNNSNLTRSTEVNKKPCLPNTIERVEKPANKSSMPPANLTQLIENFEESIKEDDINLLPITVKTMHEFLLDSYGKPFNNTLELAKLYTENLSALATFLSSFKDFVNDSILKTRLTKLIKQINKNPTVNSEIMSMSESEAESVDT